MRGVGSALARIAAVALSVLMAVALLSCGGGGGNEAPPKFTTAMLDGKVFYRENVTSRERAVIHLETGGAVVDRVMDNTGVTGYSGTWAVDNTGVLNVDEGSGIIVITLVRDTSTYMDITVGDGINPPESDRLYKTVAFSGSSLPGRYTIADKELDGTTSLGALVAIASGGTGTRTDGLSDDAFTWAVQADGSVAVGGAGPGSITFYLLAGGSYTGTLTVVGEEDSGSGIDYLPSGTWTRVAAAAGFDNAMLGDSTLYTDNTTLLQRSLMHFYDNGAFLQRMQDDMGIGEYPGTWSVGGAGNLVIDLGGGNLVGAILLADTTAYIDVLLNEGSGLRPDRAYKTVPIIAGDIPGTYTYSFKGLDGSTVDTGTVTFAPGGTGTVSGGPAFTWSINADGTLRMAWPGTVPLEVENFYLLATSTASVMYMAGEDWDGSTFGGVMYLTLR